METRSSQDQQTSQVEGDLSMNAKSSLPRTSSAEPSGEHFSHLHLLFIVIGSIFLAEVVAMIFIHRLPLPYYSVALIDAGVMTIVIAPVLYFLSFKPLILHIDKRRQAEIAAKAERQRFNDILETLPGYLVLLTPDYHVPFANHFFRERFGEARGRRCYEYLFGRDTPCEICETYKVLNTMQPGRWEWTGPDSHVYDVYDVPFTDTDGSTLILEMGIDITEQKQAEAQIREMALFPALNPGGVLQVDATGQIRKINPAAAEMGFSVGTQLTEVIPDLRELDLPACIAAGATQHIQREAHLGDSVLLWSVRGVPDLGLAFLYSKDITLHRHAEGTIRQLSRIVEQTEDTVVVTNRDGVIEYVNPSFERLTGYTKEEALGKTPRVIKSDLHDKEFYQNLWNTILAGEVFQSEMTNRKKNGEIYYEVKTITPLRDTQGNITHFVATGKDITEHKLDEEKLHRAYDELELRVQERTEELRIANSDLEAEITERKRAEETLRKANLRLQDQAEELDAQAEELRLQTEELRDANEQLSKSESTLQSILNATQESIWLFSLDGVILMANTTALARMKMPAEKIIGKPFNLFMPADIAQLRMGCLTKVTETGQALEFEDQRASIIFHHNFYPVKDANGCVTSVVAFSRDITERKQAEEALRLSEEKFAQAFANNPAAIALTRLDDGLFLDVNDTWVTLMGYCREEAIGHSARKLPIWPSTEAATRFVRELREQGSLRGWEQEFLKKSGEVFVAQLSAQLLTVQNETLILSTLIDITERRKAQEREQQLTRTLKALNRSNQVMLRSRSETELLNEVCKIIIEDCGHAMVWIGFKEEDEQKSIRPVASAGFEEGYIETLKITWADTERGRGPTGTAIRTGKASRCRNMLTDPQFAPWREQALKRGYASSIVLPLKAEENTFGAITIYSRHPDSFTDEEEQLLQEMAGDLAYGITALRLRASHAQAEEALRVSEEHYRTLFNSMTEGFALHEIICDEAGQPCDYRFLEINPSFEKLTGLEREGVVGRTVGEVLPGIEPYWIQTYGRVALTGQAAHFDNYSAALDRHYEVYAYQPAPRQFAALFMDITERKQAEEVLRRYELLSEHSRDIILFMRLEDGHILTANAAATRAYGYSREELLTLTIRDLRAPNTQSLTASQMAQAAVEGILFETVHLRKDGSTFPVEVSSQGATIGGVRTLISIVRDITERKQAEEALRESEEKYRNLFENMTEEVHFWKLVRDETGRILTWYLVDANPPTLKTWGRESVNEVKGKTTDEIFGPGSTEHYMPVVQKIMAEGMPYAYEDYFPQLDKHFRFTSVPLGEYFITTGADITIIKKSQETLQNLNAELELRVQQRTKKLNTLNKKLLNEIKERKEVERQLRIRTTAMEAAANGIVITDPQGTIQWANPALTQISGYEVQDLIGHSMRIFNSGQHDKTYYCQMWDAILAGQVWHSEIINRRKNGSLYMEEQTITPVRDEGHQIQHFIAVKQDITQRKQAEAELAEHNSRLQALSLAEHEQRKFSESLAEAALVINKSMKLDEILPLLLEQVKAVIPYQLAIIMMFDGESFYDAGHAGDERWSKDLNQVKNRFPLGDFPLLIKMRQSHQPVMISDTQKETDWMIVHGLEWSRSILCVPLLAENQVIGFLNLLAEQPDFFTTEMQNRLVAFASHASVAIQNAWLFEQVRASSERLQSLSRRLVEIQENERLYIARELHDEAGQMLTSLMLDLVTLESQAHQPESILKKIPEMEEMLSAISENLHNVAMALRPASLDHLGLVPAIRQYAEAVGERSKLKVSFRAGNFQERLPANMETELYRIVQEALTNVVRHAHATQVDVVLTVRDHKLIVIVEDDGNGFDPENVPDSGHLGLFGMRERAEMIGGQLVIESKPGKGTTIMVEVDYDSPIVDRG